MEKHKITTPSQVLQLFTDIAQRVDKCYDFEIQYWLSVYENFKCSTNFAEAALIIINAAYIYGHKVDFLKTMILNLESLKSEETKNSKPIRTNNKSIRTSKTLHDEIEFIPKSFTTKDRLSFQENIDIKNGQLPKSSNNKYDDIFQNTICRKYTTKPLIFERINLIQTYGTCPFTYGKRRIYDKDFNDIDSRWNYKVYIDCIIKESNVVCRSTEYERNLINKKNGFVNEEVNQYLEGSVKPFHLYLPSEVLKTVYDVDVDKCTYDYQNMIKYQEQMKPVLLLNLEDLYYFKNGKKLNYLLNGCGKSRNRSENENEDENIEIIEENVDKNNELDIDIFDIEKNVITNNRISIDEGLGSSIFTANSTFENLEDHCTDQNDESELQLQKIPSTDLNENKCEKPEENLMLSINARKSFDEGIGSSGFNTPNSIIGLNPVVNLFDIFNHVRKPNNFTFNIGDKDVYKINLLKIPMSNSVIENFSLYKKPKTPAKRKLIPETASEVNEKLLKLTESMMSLSDDEESEFYGFDESDLQLNGTVEKSQNKTIEESQNETTVENRQELMETTELQDATKNISSDDSGFCEEEDLSLITNRDTIPDQSVNLSEPESESFIIDVSNEQRQQQLEMSKNVKNWHDSMKSALQMSESNHFFDIDDIRNDIMNLCSKSCSISFKDVMKDQNKSYTARYFLGLLSLANMNKIVIEHPRSVKVCSFEEVIIHKTSVNLP